ncbi:MAG TPA: RpiB/LacA/LacB family sugar-phosphate isomerase [Candidatus Baltobacteraceae bacterium]|nr:RpiB/LacA/LacB family sugar-phosphate isomerase [Candidatus Baltobacteraceae bacterium]
MRIALGSDEATELTGALERELRERGHEVALFGVLGPQKDDAWPNVGRAVGEAVARGECDYGIVCCWTGTGVSIAANKVPGVRAALCADAQTAAGARTWNDANVLALSLRATAIPIAKAMLDAWFSAAPTTDAKYAAMIRQIQTGDFPVSKT